MGSHYPPSRRRRCRRAPRLVNVGDLRGARTRKPTQEIEYWDTMCDATRYLSIHFPAFFQEHVAMVPAALSSGTGAAMAFLALVRRDLFRLNPWMGMWTEGDPLQLFHAGCAFDDGEALSVLDEEVQPALSSPSLEVYGVGTDIDEIYDYCQPLIGGLWILLAATPWAAVGNTTAEINQLIGAIEPEFEDILRRVPQLPNATPLPLLVARLNVRVVCGVAQLGDLVAYAGGQTPHEMANMNQAHIDETYDGMFNVHWDDPEDLQSWSEEQAAARDYMEHCYAVSASIRERPDLLIEIAQAIHDEAWTLIPASSALIDILQVGGTLDDPANPDIIEALAQAAPPPIPA